MGVVSAGALSGLLAIAAVAASGLELAPSRAVMLLHLSLLASLIGLPFTLADPCAEIIASTPWSLSLERSMRSILAGTTVLGSWLVQISLLPDMLPTGQGLEGTGMLVEALPLILVTLAATWHLPGPRAAGAGLGAMILLYLTCWRATCGFLLFTAPNEAAYAATRSRWLVLTATSALALAVVVALPALRREMGRQMGRRRRGSGSGQPRSHRPAPARGHSRPAVGPGTETGGPSTGPGW